MRKQIGMVECLVCHERGTVNRKTLYSDAFRPRYSGSTSTLIMRFVILTVLIAVTALAFADPTPLVGDPDSPTSRLPNLVDVLTALYFFLTGTEPVDKTINIEMVDQEMRKEIRREVNEDPNPCGDEKWVCCLVDPNQIQLFPFDPSLIHFNVDYCCMSFQKISIIIKS